jgi:hypothetical protein
MLLKPAKTNLVDIYDAWRDHDLDRLASYLPSDFSHHINIPVEFLPMGGVRLGKQAAIERLAQIFDSFDTQFIEPGPMRLDDIGASLDVKSHCLHRSSKTWLHTTKRHVWLMEDGWPVSLSEVYDLREFEAFMKGALAA